jgi:hypothetical protein
VDRPRADRHRHAEHAARLECPRVVVLARLEQAVDVQVGADVPVQVLGG